jgi:hypothetical protein
MRLLEVKLKPVPVFNNAALHKAVRNHFSGVKPIYNKALINAILARPNIKLTNEERRLLAGIKNGGGGGGGGGGGFFGRIFGRRPAAAPTGPRGRATTGSQTNISGGFFSGLFTPKPPVPFGPSPLPSFTAFKPTPGKPIKIPNGYVFKTNKKGTGFYLKNAVPAATGTNAKPAGPSAPGVPAGVPAWGPGGGIVFAPKINVGAARIGAQTFGGTRVGGQQMGGSRLRGGNTGSTTLKTGSTQVSNVGKVSNSGTTSNAGRLAVSAPTSNGKRQLSATSEQLIRGAGGAEAVEKGIEALRNANGNVARAKAASRLPNNTFTNIYAMGGPNAAKRLVETRRRHRTTVGGRRVRRGGRGLRAPTKKKRVAPKPRKQYIKLTPYQFKRLTDHIKKNNLRRVLIKEITH